MTTSREMYQQGQYRQIIETVNRDSPESDDQLLDLARAHHQLGEYNQSVSIMRELCSRYGPGDDLGDSARRGLAHGLQQIGELEEANLVLVDIHASLERENGRAVAILQETRRGAAIPVLEVQQMIQRAMWLVPHRSVNAHIINNLTYALYEGRDQEVVRPYLSVLPGLIEVAIGVYQEVGVQRNHLAGCFFRAAQIFLEPGWIVGANELVDESIVLWERLVASEDGERYRNNLEGARELKNRIEALRT